MLWAWIRKLMISCVQNQTHTCLIQISKFKIRTTTFK